MRRFARSAHAHESRGWPADLLAAVADEHAARLVVLGGGDRADATTLAARVASRSPCDVLIVHAPHAALDRLKLAAYAYDGTDG